MCNSAIPPDLIDAYLGTEYRVFHPACRFSLRIGQHSPELAGLLIEGNSTSAVFITADNPFSELTNQTDNRQRSLELLAHLQAVSPLVFEGEGQGDDPAWPPERSFLALSIDRERSCQLGQRFGQNAIIWSGPDAIPQLVLLR
ncbi:MAG TPA: DUF3293 domain-containing protein [Sphingopyxis sp.]|nr:DUF3293 domain-containing protein [Sphingopyxis sp.]HMP46020.1 DUF3293 domain-containing protein [Sphingopyxis sp.]HMQ18959.1 DUF3293 domain-containing protein [Sphingopyxis sp.]